MTVLSIIGKIHVIHYARSTRASDFDNIMLTAVDCIDGSRRRASVEEEGILPFKYALLLLGDSKKLVK